MDGHDGSTCECPVFEETGVLVPEEATIGEAATGTLAAEGAAGTGVATAAAAGGGGPTLGLLAGPMLVFGIAHIFAPSVGQSDADERAAMEQASRERAAQNGGVDPQTQPAPQAQGDAEAKRKSTRTVRREWEKAKGKKWPKDKDGKNFDADHKRALADGGSNNAARNIQPRKHTDHVNRHKKNGDFKRWAKRRNTQN